MDQIKLERVAFVPKELQPATLYVADEFQVAVHLCACGCGNKVVTPLGPAEWDFEEEGGLPTLSPSVGNWQLPCRTHYVISKGRILWAGDMSDAAILVGRQAEEARRQSYYASLDANRGFWSRTWKTIKGWLGF